MKNFVCGFGLIIAALLTVTPAGAQSLFKNVDSAYRRGEIDFERALRIKAAAIKGSADDFYQAYLPADGRLGQNRSLTDFVVSLLRVWPDLSDDTRQELAVFVTLPKLTNLSSYTSTHFDIRYGTYDPPSSEFLAAYSDYLEQSWTKEIDLAGFMAPVPAGEKMIVLIGNTGTPIEGVPDSSFLEPTITVQPGVYGFATVDLTTYQPFLVVNNDYSWAIPGSSTQVSAWAEAMQATAAHEFQHCSQYAEGWGLYSGSEADFWWAEASAVWSEDFVFDDADDYLQYLRDGAWPTFPNVSLLYFNGEHEYGNVIFAKYLTEHHADDSLLPVIWDRIGYYYGIGKVSSSLAAIDDMTVGGLEAAFKGFVVDNLTMDYEEGAAYSEVTILQSFDYYPVADPNLPTTMVVSDAQNNLITVNTQPDILGANYIEFLPLAADSSADYPPVLEISFDGATILNAGWVVQLVGLRTDNSTVRFLVSLDSANEGVQAIDNFDDAHFLAAYLIPGVVPTGDLFEAAADFAPEPSSDNLYEDYPQGFSYRLSADLTVATGPCVDEDSDGYGAGCAAGEDCDDSDGAINPAAYEIPGDEIDNDCNDATGDEIVPLDDDDDDDNDDNDDDGDPITLPTGSGKSNDKTGPFGCSSFPESGDAPAPLGFLTILAALFLLKRRRYLPTMI